MRYFRQGDGREEAGTCIKKESWEWLDIFRDRPCELWSGIGDEKISDISCLRESSFPDLGGSERTLRVFSKRIAN